MADKDKMVKATTEDGRVVYFEPGTSDEEILATLRGSQGTAPAREQTPARRPNPADAFEQGFGTAFTPEAPDMRGRQSYINKFVTGLDRLPNLVGVGNVSTGFQRADLSPAEASGRVLGGATAGVAGLGRGLLEGATFGQDENIIAAISEGVDVVRGRDTGSFSEKRDALKAQQKNLPGIGVLPGQIIGYTLSGRGLAKGLEAGVKRATGRNLTVGVGGEAALGAGAAAALDGGDPVRVATEATIGAVGGKAFQGLADKVGAPLAKRIMARFGKGLREGEIDAKTIRLIQSRTDLTSDEIVLGMEEWASVSGGNYPTLAELTDDKNIALLRGFAQRKPSAARVFREAEDRIAGERPGVLEDAVKATGDTQDIAPIRAATRARKRDEAEAFRRERIETRRDARAAQDRFDDDIRNERLQLETSLDEEMARAANELRDDIDEMIELEDYLMSPARVEKMIDDWADRTMRASDGRQPPLADEMITIPSAMAARTTLPTTPTLKALRLLRENTVEGTPSAQRIETALENFGKTDIVLSIDEVDKLRQALSKVTDESGIRYDTRQAGRALGAMAGRQSERYSKFLKKYEELQKAREAYVIGRQVTGPNPRAVAADIADAAPRANEEGAIGGAEGVLAQIAEQFETGSDPVRVARSLLARRRVLETSLGDDGPLLVARLQRAVDEADNIDLRRREGRAALDAEQRRQPRNIRDDRDAALDDIDQREARFTDAIESDEAAIDLARNLLRRSRGDVEEVMRRGAAGGVDDALLGQMARQGIIDEGQTPDAALRVFDDLRRPATQGRVSPVIGNEAAEQLGRAGQEQVQGARRLRHLAVEDTATDPNAQNVEAIIDILAAPGGGAGFKANATQRFIRAAADIPLTQRQSATLARAITRNDKAALEEIIRKIAANEEAERRLRAAVARIAPAVGVIMTRRMAEDPVPVE